MEFSPRAAELTTLLESRISHFYTHFQVDGPYSDFFSGFLVLLIMLSVISLMEGPRSNRRKGKAVATTSAGGGGHNADDDDERKRKEADEKYRIWKIRQTEKEMAEFIHSRTKGHRLFPRSPSLQEWETVTRRVCDDLCSELDVPPESRRGYVNGLFTQLTIDERDSSRFDQFLNEMIKFLSEHK